jgi:heptosyltransferase-1
MKVLVVKTSSMGDIIHSFPAIEDARQARPDITFDWCAEDAFAGIAALHPAIRIVHKVALRRWRKALLNGGTWREASGLREALRAESYELVIDAQGLMKSALVARQAAAPIAGYDRRSAREPSAALFYDRRYTVSRGLHAIERTRRLFGLALGYEPDLSRLDSGIVSSSLQTDALPQRSVFLLHGTSREDKKWPVEDWIEAARLLVERQMIPVATWTDEREQGVAQAIAETIPQTILVPKSPLMEIAAKLGQAALVIGTDTGLTHLANAYGLPTVAVFLTTKPHLAGPIGPFSSSLLAGPDGGVSPAAVIAEADRLMALREKAGIKTAG